MFVSLQYIRLKMKRTEEMNYDFFEIEDFVHIFMEVVTEVSDVIRNFRYSRTL
jgi:hypothetical protein